MSANPRVSIAAPARTLATRLHLRLHPAHRERRPPRSRVRVPASAAPVCTVAACVWRLRTRRTGVLGVARCDTPRTAFMDATCRAVRRRRVGRPSSVVVRAPRRFARASSSSSRVAPALATQVTAVAETHLHGRLVVPSVARRSRRRVTRGAPIFMSRARSTSFERVIVGARGTDRHAASAARRMGEWPRECVSLRETSQRRCTTRRGSGELTR